jgi:hypothetical protein
MNLRKNNAPDEGVVVDEAGQSASRKKLFVAGGVAAALVAVGGLSYVVLGSGGDDVPTGAVAVTHTPAASQPTDAPSTATSAPAIAKFKGSNARDPFKALVVENAAATSGTGSAAATSSGSSSSSTSGSSSSAGASTSGSTTGGTGTGTAATGTTAGSGSTDAGTSGSTTYLPRPKTGLKVTLVSVVSNDTSAVVTVDGQKYTVKPLDEFDTYFRLLNLRQGRCGAVQFGDVAFDLCEGQSITVH